MSGDIVRDLRIANARGVHPPQDWTHRAIEEIERLRRTLSFADNDVKRLTARLDRIAEWCTTADATFSRESVLHLARSD